ncbi:hypothetical protein ACIP93_33880 [Streptomyces sp. NPDC088745]|uniref:hypothetical protein n=1 Tax=Streptomyces sp. NPDC088745 TaxID=3365884 RepID=UPI003824A48D
MSTEPNPTLPSSLSLWPEDYVSTPEDIKQQLVDALMSNQPLTSREARRLVDAYERHFLDTVHQERIS